MRKSALMPDYDYNLRSHLFDHGAIRKRAKRSFGEITDETLRRARHMAELEWQDHKRSVKRKAERTRRRLHLKKRTDKVLYPQGKELKYQDR